MTFNKTLFGFLIAGVAVTMLLLSTIPVHANHPGAPTAAGECPVPDIPGDRFGGFIISSTLDLADIPSEDARDKNANGWICQNKVLKPGAKQPVARFITDDVR